MRGVGDTVVFVGPTLAAAEVRAALPDATLAPPAAAGDILRLACARRPPRRLALVDGYFERMAAPWHKELLYALERGVRVYGAASMGALRAAELAPFGMIGVGRIFEGYARGTIVADDEVAVAHAPAERGYAPATVALVNVRFAVAAAARRGALSTRDATRVLEAARGVFYRDRDNAAILAAARAAGVSSRALARWGGVVPDQKAADARALLRRLARDADPPPPRVRVERTWALGVFADWLGVTLRP